MRRNKKQKKSFVVTLCLLLTMVLGIGYAVLTQQLSIGGSVEYEAMKWNVGFKTATDGGGTINSNPSISEDKKSITISCNVGTSTESEICIVNAVIANNSTFDVELESNPTITYDSTYISSVNAVWSDDSKGVVKSDTITSDSEREMIITITTRKLSSEMLPEENLSLPVEITMNWLEKSNVGGEELPTYWKTYLDSKIVEINKKTNDMETGSDSFIFITDQHLDGSLDYSSSIINYITGNTSVKKVVFGGDILQGSQDDEIILSEYRTSFDDSLLVMPVRGNHDADGNLNDNTYYNIMIKSLEDKIENNNKLYYYYDNDNSKIRYIFTDSTSAGETDLISNEQITWMKEKILELESDWTVLVFVHGIWTGSETNSELVMSNQGNKIVNAIDEVYDQANCAIAGVYTGHTHRDYYKQTEKGYFLVSTTLDASNSGLTKYDPVNPVRNSGTTEEQSFDIVFINTKNKNVETIRIGVGNNRVFNYEKNNYIVEKNDITDKFTWTAGTINIKENGVYTSEYSDLWLYSNAVDVSAYKSITFTHIQTTSSGTTAGYAFYDKDGNFISGGSNYGGSYAPVEKTINVPSNAKYFRTMWMNTGHSSYSEEIHNIDTKFKCYGNKVVVSNNTDITDITDKFTWTAGTINIENNGTYTNEYSDLWLYSNAVDVSAYKSITFTHIQTTSSGTTAGYAFYDKDGKFIIGGSNSGESYAPVEKTIFVPTNAKYFRTMWMNTGHSSYSEEIHNIDTKFKCYGNKVAVSNDTDITSQFEWTAGSIQYSTGIASEEFSDSWLYSNEVDISAYKSITFTHIQTTNPSTPLGYAFYDENHTYISGATNSGTSYNPTIKTIKVPSNAKYFRTMWINTTNASYDSVSHNISTIFKCYGNK